MTQINHQMRRAANLRVRIGTDNFEKHVNNVTFTPTVSRQSWQGGTEDSFIESEDLTGFTANIDLGNDYDNPDSLYHLIRANAGDTAEIEWQPNPDSPYTETATITFPHLTIGGPRGQYHQQSIACMSSKPVAAFATLVAPVITTLTPDEGAAAGGTLVAIVGTGFRQVTAVTFDGTDATSFFVISPTLIHAYAPAHAAGAIDVIVTNSVDDSAGSEYTYTA
jgi:hypothetical protein